MSSDSIKCECGIFYNPSYHKNHIKCKAHQDYLKHNITVDYYTDLGNGYLKCKCGITFYKPQRTGHEKTNHHIRYVNTPKGKEFIYHLSRSGIPRKDYYGHFGVVAVDTIVIIKE